MISAISPNNIINSFKNQSMKRPVNDAGFRGMYSSSGDKLKIKPKTMAQINMERSCRIAMFVTAEAAAKYNKEKQFVQEIKDDIQNKMNKGVKKPYSVIMEYGGNNITVDADYDIQDGSIILNSVVRNNRNGSKDIIDLDEKGDITKISNGLMTLSNGNTIIKEEIIYKNGLIERLRIDINKKRLKNFIMTEILYSNGKIKEARENVTETIFGKKFIEKRDFFNS